MQLPFYNVEIKHWNREATMPLILPVNLICNTDDEQIYSNIRQNSRNGRPWLQAAPQHDGVAIICGSAPSLADTLDEVRVLQANGGSIFALNGAAKFLNEHRILADFQVMIDARPETADLIGPARAHLFASQCSPVCFELCEDAVVWHLEVENIDDLLPVPDDDADLMLIGGAAAVGNTAMCLAYGLGFRDIHCFGMDSSNRDGKSHAMHQKINDGEPCAIVNWRGKEYVSSLTMKLQAEKFQTTARELKRLGCSIAVYGSGLLPDIYNAPESNISEVDKYTMMWDVPQYRIGLPGKETAQQFVDHFMPAWDETVIDFGCGTGTGGLEIQRICGAQVTLVDFTTNCLNEEAKELPFVIADLTKPMGLFAGYGYCTDVMEHIPPHQVNDVILNIMDCVEKCFFRIDFQDDLCGAYIGETLHLSVHDHGWWVETFERLGFTVRWTEDHTHYGVFHVEGIK
jgi:hypothetical protein